MTRLLCAAAISCLTLTAAAPPASAHPFTTAGAHCAFATTNEPTADPVISGPNIHNGVYVTALTAADAPSGGSWHYAGNPVFIDLQCRVRVNGVTAVTWTATGTSFAMTSGVLTYFATDSDVVELCVDRWLMDSAGNMDLRTFCGLPLQFQTPPQLVVDLMCVVAYEVRRLDEALCGPDRVLLLPGMVTVATL